MAKRKRNLRPTHNGGVGLEDDDVNRNDQSDRCAVVREEPFQPQSDVRAIPLEGAIRAGKNTYVYDAHTYHTKVPPSGIAQLIEYYTKPGDVVLDPFCGSGMTGVAAAPLGRRVLLSDISPAAVFIARHLNSPIDSREYMNAVREI